MDADVILLYLEKKSLNMKIALFLQLQDNENFPTKFCTFLSRSCLCFPDLKKIFLGIRPTEFHSINCCIIHSLEQKGILNQQPKLENESNLESVTSIGLDLGKLHPFNCNSAKPRVSHIILIGL